MENDFQIKLSAIVDLTSIDTQIQNHFNSKKFKINVEANVAGTTAVSSDGTVKGVDASKITKAENAARDLQTRLNNLFNTTKIGKDEFNDFNQRLQEVQASFSKTNNLNTFSKELNKLKNEISETSTKFIKATEAQNENYAAQGRQEKRLNQINNQYKSFKQALSNAYTQGQLNKEQYSDMSALLENNYKAYHDAVDGITEYGSQEKDLISASTQWNNSLKDQRNVLSGLKADYQAHSQDLTKIIGKYLKWYTIATVVSLVINSIKKMVTEVKNLDKAMTELNKVTDVSNEKLNEVKNQAFEIAKGLGRTGKEVIEATTEFARMGYAIDESLELSKVAVMMTNVAEGITDTGEAAEKIISILKGIGVESKYAMSLLDRLNNVANKNAISFDKLADMLQNSAATMNILGNNLDETIALLTAGFEVLQDEKVATGLQTIGLRIAGLNEDLEEEAGLANDVSRALEKYAGISVWDKETGALKNTYAILSEVAEKWDEIGEKAGYQESLLNILAGKRQANVAGAIIKNFDAIEKVMNDLKDAEGSAARENEVYMNSIEGHINALKGAFQELANQVLSSDLVKFIVDFLTNVIKLIKGIGGLVPILTVILGLVVAIKGQAILTGLVTMIKSVWSLITALRAATVAATGFQAAMGWIGLIIAGIGLVVAAINGIKSASESAAESTQKAYENISDTFKKNTKVTNEYGHALTKLIAKLKELILLEDAYDESTSMKERLEEIKKANEQAKKEKELQEKILNVEKARLELAQAKNKQIRVFRAGRGFVYEADESEVQAAQQNLSDALQELSEYRYELILDRAEAFIKDFSDLAEQDISVFLDGWKNLFDAYGDLLETEFGSFLKMAQDFTDGFLANFSPEEIENEQTTLAMRAFYESRIKELEAELSGLEEGTKEYAEILAKLKSLKTAYNNLMNEKYTNSYKSSSSVSIPKEHQQYFLGSEGGGNKYMLPVGIGARYASGTNYATGGLSLVGEEGPELVNLPMGAKVHTASETRSVLSGLQSLNNGSNTVFNVGTVEITEPNNFDGFVSQFCTKLNVPNPIKLST